MAQEHEHIKPCSSCGAPIVFLRTKSRKLMPIDAATVDHDDYDFDAKKHTSHFATCPNAPRHRR